MSQAPRLRTDIEAFPVEQDGQRLVGVRDPAGYTSSVVLFPSPLVAIVSLFDGRRSIVEIQAELMRRHGELVRGEHIEQIIASLDEHGFLDSPRFAERRHAVDLAFLTSPARPAAHAGGAYAADPEELRRAMDGFFTAPGGPGAPAVERSEIRRPGRVPRGLIAPHIDFHRGGPAYAWAYRDLVERSDADCFVIFGTCHAGIRDPFVLTRKDYATPLGPGAADHDLIEGLAARARQDCFASELAHRGEHSIEFQVVFLRYLFGGRREFTIVPVLASFAHEALARGEGPEDDPRVPRFLDALAETMATSGRKVVLIAGADLAHVGPRFGDPTPIAAAELQRLAREDRAMLATVEAGDAPGFFRSIAADQDRRRICGFSPIYALLRTLGNSRGEVKHYGQWPDPQAVVTFASVVF
ncbi:MAG: AmmeMemoRadiSam system protein B [Candidatus Rokuibacteriota bacterium]